MIRYLEESHGATASNGRASEDAKYKDQEKKLSEVYSLRTTGQCRTSDAWTLIQQEGPGDGSYSGWTIDKYWTSNTLQRPDVRPSPEIRRHVNRAKTPDVRQVPDDRTLVSHQTSGTRRMSNACLCTVYLAEPMYPFALTYPFVALDYIYSSTSS